MGTIVHYTKVKSPQGHCIIMATNDAIIWASTPQGKLEDGKDWILKHVSEDVDFIEKENEILKNTKKELEEYFAGQNIIFTGPFHFEGTPFQRAVWKEMLAIPYGETVSYKEVAKRIKKPQAARGVGSACRANPIAILNPCHRIVGANGDLTGYAGKKGIPVKKWLLELEGWKS